MAHQTIDIGADFLSISTRSLYTAGIFLLLKDFISAEDAGIMG